MRKIKYLFSAIVIVFLCCMAAMANEASTLDEYLAYTAGMMSSSQGSVMPSSVEDSRFGCKRLLAEFTGDAYLPDGITPVDYVLFEDTAVFAFGTTAQTEYAYNILINCPDVENVMIDSIITLDIQADGVIPAGDYEAINATLQSSNWGIDAVHANTYKEYVSGQNADEIVVGIIDTGLAIDHPYFKDSPRVIEGYNLTLPAFPVTDYLGHGTHVAGIISAASSDNVKIKMYQIFDSSSQTSNLMLYNAIRKAVADGVDVINISLTAVCENGFSHGALDEAYAAGIIVAVAAGNGGEDKIADPVADFCPGHYSEHLVTVGAINSGMVADTYSNYGPEVDICAPGTKVYSTYYDSKNNTFGYANMTGTSMATPFVSAYAAMMKSVSSNLTFENFCLEMRQNATVPKDWDAERNGVGILNMASSVSLIEGMYTHMAQFVNNEELKEISFDIKLENQTADPVDFMIHLAFLDGDGIQIGSDVEGYRIKSGKKLGYSVPLDYIPPLTASVKAYVWTDDMEPISMGREYYLPVEN